MTEALIDPQEEFFAQDPSILTEPEQVQIDTVAQNSHKVAVAAGLAAAYLIYHEHMARRLKQAVRKKGGEITRNTLLYAASGIWNSFVPHWASMTAPYLVAGYLEGIRAADVGDVPVEVLESIARNYALDLGKHINDVSLDSMLSGFQAQVNRRVPPAMAARRVADAYGVPQRGMNALVNVWGTEEPKKLTDQVLPNARDQRAQALIEAQSSLRARQIGDNEHWAARTQAKQIVWMYGVDKGVLPSSARRVWITADDERVCEICGPMDGVSAQVGKKFNTSQGQYWTPPTHVNCRCDVVLDLAPSGDIADEITALLESEQVRKALGRDPYDRDKRGRFARDEGRFSLPYKEREADIDALLAQVNEVLSKPAEPKEMKLGGTKLGGSLASPKLGSSKLASPKLGSSLGSGTKTGMRSGARTGSKFDIGLSSSLFNTPISKEPVETSEGHWQPLDHPLVVIVPDWGDTVVDYTDEITLLLDRDETFYEIYPHDSTPDKYERSLQKALGDYWNDVETQLMDDFAMKDSQERSYYDNESGMAFQITEDDYQAALIEAINGIPMEQSDKLTLHGYGEFNDDSITITMYELASYTDIFNEVNEHTPHLVVTKHGFPGEAGPKEGKPPDVWSNPGKWKLIGDASSERYLTHYPYQVHYAEPTDLLD